MISDSESDKEKDPPAAIELINEKFLEIIEKLEKERDRFYLESKNLKREVKRLTKENESFQKIPQNFEKTWKKQEESKIQSESKSKPNNGPQYDIVVKVNSLMAAGAGWSVEFKDDDIEAVEKKSLFGSSFGFLGRRKVGKSFIVNKICGDEFALGNYSTEGLSVIYCKDPTFAVLDQTVAVLDTPGIGDPILFYKNNEMLMGKVDDFIKEMTNDMGMTEYFIQNFIADSCDIIVLVVDQLTQNDQKMIERMKYIYKPMKTVIIIHNMHQLEHKEEVQKMAQYIIESAFQVKQYIIPGSEVLYYMENPKDSIHNKIIHLIQGKEGCPSGDFFNKPSLDFLKKFFMMSGNSQFKLLEKLNKHWTENHKVYCNNFVETKEIPQFKLTKSEQLKMTTNISKDNWLYKLDFDQKMDLQTMELNPVGSLKDTNVKYHVYTNQQSKFREKIYFFELPGCDQKPSISLKSLAKEGEQVLTLTIKPNSNMKPEGYIADIGGFSFDSFIKKVKINDEYGEYDCEKDFTRLENGILRMRFTLREEEF